MSWYHVATPYSTAMWWSGCPAWALADRLVAACSRGDLLSVQAAVADGASVNEKGETPGDLHTYRPLTQAVMCRHDDVVVWLLAQGADPSGDGVLEVCACRSPKTLQLLVDAGGDVNVKTGAVQQTPLFSAVYYNRVDSARILLAQPSLDFTVANYGQTTEQYLRPRSHLPVALLCAQEVSGGGHLSVLQRVTDP